MKENAGKFGRYFPGTNLETIKKTLRATTQYGTRGAIDGVNLRNQILSPNPVLNVPRRHEDVAMDTLYGSVAAIDDGSTSCQFYIGRTSTYRTVRPLGNSDKEVPRTLMDEIRRLGAMDRLISDNAKAEISKKVKDILRMFVIDDWQSEPYKGNQNFAERGWRDTKAKVNNLLNYTGAPSEVWLLALAYVCFVQNHTAIKSLGWRTPAEWLLGYTPDISVLLQFEFWEPVYYAKYDPKFPSDGTECLGRFVGISEHVGHAMTFKILTEDRKVIHRAVVRTATKGGMFENKRAQAEAPNLSKGADETVPEHEVETVEDDEGSSDEEEDPKEEFIRSAWEDVLKRRGELEGALPTLGVKSLLGRTFISNPDEEGEQVRAKVEAIEDLGDKGPDHKSTLYRFRCRVGEETFEEIMTYNKMLEWCERDVNKDNEHDYEEILEHRPMRRLDPRDVTRRARDAIPRYQNGRWRREEVPHLESGSSRSGGAMERSPGFPWRTRQGTQCHWPCTRQRTTSLMSLGGSTYADM
jgi:hypothetical protein